MRKVRFAHHHEDPLARGSLHLFEERDRFGHAIHHVAGDDEIRRGDLCLFPGARDDRHVVEGRDVRAHAFGRLDGGHPFEAGG